MLPTTILTTTLLDDDTDSVSNDDDANKKKLRKKWKTETPVTESKHTRQVGYLLEGSLGMPELMDGHDRNGNQ